MDEKFNFSEMQKSRKTRKKRKHIKIAVNIIASIVLTLSILINVVGAIYLTKGASFRGDPSFGNFKEDVAGSEHSGVSYILVVGLCPPEEHALLTDTIIVACIDHDRDKLNFLQIPRDFFVGNETGSTYSGGKINAAYAKGRNEEGRHDPVEGVSELARVINNHLGIPIDHYVMFDIKTFIKLIDALGGLEITIQQDTGVTLRDYDTGIYSTVGPGKVNLKGSLAVGYMRKRKGVSEGYIMGDADRVKAQQLVYIALAKELKKMSLSEMWKIARDCYFTEGKEEGFKTDLDLDSIIGYALEVKNMTMENMGVYAVPGQYSNYNGSSVYSIHKDAYLEMLNAYFNPYGEKKDADDIYAFEWHTYVGDAYEPGEIIKGGTLAQLAKDKNQN